MGLPAGYCRVDVEVSIVCADEDGTRAWSLLRDFGRWHEFHGPFEEQPVRSTMLMGEQERTSGARRVLSVGTNGKLVEQLSAFDEDQQRLAWKLVTHNANVNPFPSTFVNYSCAVRVRRSTLTQQSLVEVTASFMTDAAAAGAMRASVAALHEAALRGLAQALAAPPSQQPRNQPARQQRRAKPVGSFDVFGAPASPPTDPLREFVASGPREGGENGGRYGNSSGGSSGGSAH